MLTRRELTILLLALSTFIVAYNYDSSIHRISSASIYNFSASSLFGVQNVLQDDGRRVDKYADDLEKELLGVWEIDRPPVFDLDPHGVTQEQQRKSWATGDVPVTHLIAHVPGIIFFISYLPSVNACDLIGYTVLENVLLSNGTLYLVSDHASYGFPKPDAMISTGLDSPYRPVLQDLSFISRHQVIELFGYAATRYVLSHSIKTL